jgi:integrase/recombinase XerD
MTTKLNQPPSELYQSNLLQTAIFLASYLETLDAKTFAEVDKKIMLVFLGSKFEDGKWVLRERDIEDRWIATFNHNLGLCRVFYRWLFNQDKERDEWVTPGCVKIKNMKTKRISPYTISQVWTSEELLSLIKYEPKIRNKAIMTMSWDMNARNHELRIGDIQFKDNYAEGTIPFKTKTGRGTIMASLQLYRIVLTHDTYQHEIKGMRNYATLLWSVLFKCVNQPVVSVEQAQI